MTRRKFLTAASVALCLSLAGHGQSVAELWGPACDSINSYLQRATGVKGECRLRKVTRKGGDNDFYFTQSIGGYPLRVEDVKWIRAYLGKTASSLGRGRVRRIKVRTRRLEDLVTPAAGNSGRAPRYGKAAAKSPAAPFVERLDAPKASKGLAGRHIALWQSHGLYFNEDEGRWMWQRAPVHRTIEDIFTQSYVTPFLIPMLENAGAFVMSPRETDYNTEEVLCDNDSTASSRRKGTYLERGRWTYDGPGFADTKETYTLADNPFTFGSARKSACRPSAKGSASAVWKPGFTSMWKGQIYVSYRSGSESSRCALYKVHHAGGVSRIIVDQTRGGGCWIRLGEFEMGPESYVELSSATPEGKPWREGTCVSADAVRFGGGMGKVCGGPENTSTSGMPAWCEGALYNMPWSGVDSTVFRSFDANYTNDYACRGRWVKYMKDEKRIPFDISLAFHTDAGVAGRDTTIGTLAIYTLLSERRDRTSDGVDRMNGRLLAETVQSQVVDDIRTAFRSDWTRRDIRDKPYSESRTPDVPALLLELLSHQNYADMKCGLDPRFKFAASRAVYKGILKYFAAIYKKDYVVQPLPVKDFSAELKDGGGNVLLSWSARADSLEPTATAGSFEVWMRKDGSAWVKAASVKEPRAVMPLEKGHIFSYKVTALNEGGASFPSEILSVGVPFGAEKKALIVNAFTDIRGPKGFEDENYAGFLPGEDSGVPYLEDRSFAGDVYNFRRSDAWTTDNEPGFGACWTDCAGERVAGNSFDYPSIHGKALMALGWAFSSKSASTFTGKEDCDLIDIIGGKQDSLLTGRLLSALDSAPGKNLIISGAGLARDLGSAAEEYARLRLGFRWQGGHPCRNGLLDNGMEIWNAPNPTEYCVENPSSIAPAGFNATLTLRYKSSGQGAAVFNEYKGAKSASFGFPLECLRNGTDIEKTFALCLEYFDL